MAVSILYSSIVSVIQGEVSVIKQVVELGKAEGIVLNGSASLSLRMCEEQSLEELPRARYMQKQQDALSVRRHPRPFDRRAWWREAKFNSWYAAVVGVACRMPPCSSASSGWRDFGLPSITSEVGSDNVICV